MIAPGRSLVPPRPNPGPDPLPQPSFNPFWLFGLIPALLAVSAVWFVARKRRARHAGIGSNSNLIGDSVTNSPPTPAEQMLRLAGSVRKDLIDRLGPVWRARTTEELKVSAELLDVLGSENFAELVHFLDQVDQLKFAPVRLLATDAASPDSDLERWQPVVDSLRNRLSAYRPKPPSPKRNGSITKRDARAKAQPRTLNDSRTAPS